MAVFMIIVVRVSLPVVASERCTTRGGLPPQPRPQAPKPYILWNRRRSCSRPSPEIKTAHKTFWKFIYFIFIFIIA